MAIGSQIVPGTFAPDALERRCGSILRATPGPERKNLIPLRLKRGLGPLNPDFTGP